MQKVVGFFSKPENLFVLTLLIGLFTGRIRWCQRPQITTIACIKGSAHLYISILSFLDMYIPFLG